MLFIGILIAFGLGPLSERKNQLFLHGVFCISLLKLPRISSPSEDELSQLDSTTMQKIFLHGFFTFLGILLMYISLREKQYSYLMQLALGVMLVSLIGFLGYGILNYDRFKYDVESANYDRDSYARTMHIRALNIFAACEILLLVAISVNIYFN